MKDRGTQYQMLLERICWMKLSKFQILKLLEFALTQEFLSLLRRQDFSLVILNQYYLCIYVFSDWFILQLQWIVFASYKVYVCSLE